MLLNMISRLSGVVQHVDNGQLEIRINLLDLDLLLHVPTAGKFALDQTVVFYTYMHWNQEQGPTLFGFEDRAQRSLFIAMIGCSGIGPKMAIAILEQLGAIEFINAIGQQNIKLLTTVSGIGAKKAEQIIVNLKHKVDKLIEQKDFASLGGGGAHFTEIRNVLISLNYSNSEVATSVDHVKQLTSDKNGTFDLALRQALSFLSKKM